MRTKFITNFILGELIKVKGDEAISHSALITDVLATFPNLKRREYAANRINAVLRNRSLIQRWQKFKGDDKKIYIRRKEENYAEK